ncbi:MAG: GntR family transcriptional regulator, partial [Christensenellales bacterium]|nr:GntR family transcriptional regulator [Christensenellales bacterium]
YTVYIQLNAKGRNDLNVIISNASGMPIYEQIVSQIKQKILSGELMEGEMLPSIRALAKDLRISVITTKRAYDELEHEGLICTVAGKGCFVAARNKEWVREELLRKIEEHLQEISVLASQAGVSGEELCVMLRTLNEEDEHERH